MATILPRKENLGWTVIAFLFYPLLVILGWGLSTVFSAGVEMPGLWGEPLKEVLPLFLLSYLLTAFARGGNEEPGWRGVLQPELQKKVSPLGSALIIAVIWSLWHLPLYLNGFYSGPVVGGMLGGFIFRIFLSIFLTWFYNRSKGNVLAMILLHTSFNMVVNFLPTSDAMLAILWLLNVHWSCDLLTKCGKNNCLANN